MRKYNQYCPVAVGAEIFAERWTPLIVRELLAGDRRFGELIRGLPGVPRSMLSRRLSSLLVSGIVTRRPIAGRSWEYSLTEAGKELAPIVEALGTWGFRHAHEDLRPDVHTTLFEWFARRRIWPSVRRGRVVVQLDFRDPRDPTCWIILDGGIVDVCLIDPGLDIDLSFTADVEVLMRVYLGELDLRQAVRNRLVDMSGSEVRFGDLTEWLTDAGKGGPRSRTERSAHSR